MLSIKALVRQSWKTYTDCWQTLLFISAITIVTDKLWATIIMPALAAVFGLAALAENDPIVVASSGIVGIVAILLSWIVVFIIGIWGSATQIITINTHAKRKQPLIAELYEHAKPFLGPLTILSIFSSLAIGLGLILLILPGLVLAFLFQFIPFVVVLEKKTGWQAISQSAALASEDIGGLLVRNIIMLLGALLLNMIFQNGVFWMMLAQAIAFPLAMVYQYTLYKSLARK